MFRLRKGFGRSVTNEDGIAISDTDRDNVPLGASSKRGIKGDNSLAPIWGTRISLCTRILYR
jgi:hypothetical protein